MRAASGSGRVEAEDVASERPAQFDRWGRSPSRLGSAVAIGLLSLVALAALTRPFWSPLLTGGGLASAGGGGQVWMGVLVLALCVAALVLEAGAGLGPKAVAVLGALVAMIAALRLVETVLPGPGGFSPLFALVVLAGYGCGARFGFLTGALGLAVSALATAGVGPWLPYQAVAAGWVGGTAGLLPGAGRRAADVPDTPGAVSRGVLVGLAVFAAAWGFGYGLLLSLWGWAWFDPGAAVGQGDGAGLAAAREALIRYGVFYGGLSFGWDAFRALGNALLVLALGAPVLTALRRLRRWFGFGVIASGGGTGAGLEATEEAGAEAGGSYERSGALPGLANGDLLGEQVSLASLRPAGSGLAPGAWGLWLLVAAAWASATRNPLLLGLAGLAIVAVRAALRHVEPARGEGGRAEGLRVERLAPAILLLAAAYNMALSRVGAHVLWRLPAEWPLIGGGWTLEALAYGLTAGLSLVVILMAFVTLQEALAPRELVRLAPRAFAGPAIVAAVALTWLPALDGRWREARDARALRGLEDRGPKAWLALLGPVIVGALERATQLAEAMAARGLVAERPPSAAARAAVVGGLVAIAVGLLGPDAFGWPAIMLGALAFAGGLQAAGRGPKPTSLRALRWGLGETVLALSVTGGVVAAMTMPALRSAVAWQPLPAWTAPPSPPAAVLAVAVLALPALILVLRRSDAAARGAGEGGSGGDDRVEAAEPSRSVGGLSGDRAVGANMSPAEASSSPEVSWSDLVFAYPGRRPVLNGLAHRLDGGGLTWLAGASGVGKSTLLRTINGLAPHFTGGAVGGRVRVAGRDPVRLGPAGMSPYVGFVAGDPEAREIAETVADELAYALERQGRPTAEILVRLHRALDAVGLAGFAGRRLSTLSGGERQRVAVAAAIVSGARVLALDEPTSQLDDVAAARVMDALESLSHAGVTVILAGHRARRLAPRVGAAMWLASGRAEAVDPAEAARRLAAAAPALDVPPGGAFGAVRIELRDLRFDWCVEGSGEDRSSDGGPDPLAALGEGRPMLDGVDLRVRAGEIVVLTGPSGAGKTTLLRLALGQLRPWEGEARMAGEAVTGRPLREVGRLVAYVPQEAGALLLADSVREELRLTRQGRGLEGRRAVPSDGLAGRGGAERREAEGEAEEIEDLLARLGLSSLAERYPRDLSTGERQRVVVAAMAAGRPAAMLLDEPTRGLDRAALVAVAAEIQALAAAGTAVLVATHDRRLWAAAHRRVALVAGALVDRPTAGTAGPTDEGV